MGNHTSTTGPRPEPVAIAAAVQAVLAALVTLGWVQLDDARISAIGTVVALVAAVYVTVTARSAVTPISNPTAADGQPLVPADRRDQVPAAQLLEREGRIRVLA